MARTPAANVARMEKEIRIHDAELERLLADAEDEEPFLVARRAPEAAHEAREELDEQILAGLVKPY